MTKVLSFSKLRFIAPAVSVLLLSLGILVTVLFTGINLGIDFEAGVNIGLKIAPVALRVSYIGDDEVELNLRGGILTLEITGEDETQIRRYPLSDYSTLEALTLALSDVEGIVIESESPGTTQTSQLLTLNYPRTLGRDPVVLNQSVAQGAVAIDTVRSILSNYEDIQIKIIGAPANQEFQIRVPEEKGARDFDQQVSGNLKSLLESEFGNGTVLIQQTDYVGARLSQNLAQQTVYLSVLALALILVYIWFRFKLAYAVSAIAALVHDTLFMFVFVSISGMEFSTATIAAILTIIGYSLNDTIVIFDRIRENTGLMRNTSIREVADTSITQSLSRTLMTSVTTLLAVIALYAFGTGSIRDFALAVIFGVLIGTYSSLFIASPLLIAWISTANRRRRTRDAQRYGTKVTELKTETKVDSPGQTEAEKPAQRKDVEIPLAERKLKRKRKKN